MLRIKKSSLQAGHEDELSPFTCFCLILSLIIKFMDVLFEILKYVLPSAIVFLTVYLLLKQYFEQERFKMMSLQQK